MKRSHVRGLCNLSQPIGHSWLDAVVPDTVSRDRLAQLLQMQFNDRAGKTDAPRSVK